MQTITFSGTNISAYIFEDDDTITITAAEIVCPELRISDMNSSNATVHTGVTPPEDWIGGKYFFDGSSWSANLDYVKPPIPFGCERLTE